MKNQLRLHPQLLDRIVKDPVGSIPAVLKEIVGEPKVPYVSKYKDENLEAARAKRARRALRK